MGLLGWSLGLAAGIAAASWLPTLPPQWSLAALAALALCCALSRRWLAVAAMSLGLLWGIGHGHCARAALLPAELEGEIMELSGHIADLPASYPLPEGGWARRFVLRVASSEPPSPVRSVRLSWYGGPPVQAGARWHLTVRLKRPYGFANPGGFDYQAWLLRHGLDATGYVRDGRGERNERLAGWAWSALGARTRGALRARLDDMLGERPFAPLIMALLIGDRHRISQEQWAVLQGLGISHLVAISGLHIGLAALWGYWLCAGLARGLALLRVAGLQRWPAQSYGAVGGLLCALAYAALAGFSLPTQRALIMVSVVMLARLLRRRWHAGSGISAALCAALVLDPLAARGAGGWLSFVAVAALLYGLAGARRMPFGLALLHTQWLVTVALALPLLVFFGQFPWLSAAANLVAVPWVSMLVVPLCLASLSLLWWSPLATALALAAHACWAALYGALSWLYHAAGDPYWLLPSNSVPAVALAAAGTLWLLAPRGMPARWLGVVMWLPMAWPSTADQALLRVTVLDVGQGLSVLVRTAEHVLLYDTGARVSERFDAGSMVVLPYLRHLGIHRIHLVVLSHDDIDHTGGFASVAQELDIDRVLAPMADVRWRRPATACRTGMRWRWDGVAFEVLHPGDPSDYAKENNRSCVLMIRAGKARILLSGDVERRAERDLLDSQRAPRAVDVLTAPHHGSKTSSSPAFVRAWRPRYVVYSTGYRNRYFHPHPSVVRRWQRAGARDLRTVDGGAIEWVVAADGTLLEPTRWRDRAMRYWGHWSNSHAR